MDVDPRIKEINRQIENLHNKIQQQRQTLQQTILIKKLIEWRKLKHLQTEYKCKCEFRKKLRENIEKSRSRRKTKRRAIY